MPDTKRELASYIRALSSSAAGTSRAEDRAAYTQHLAAAALLFEILHTGADGAQVEKWIGEEQRNFGVSFLSGPEGSSAETAFQRLIAILKNRTKR